MEKYRPTRPSRHEIDREAEQRRAARLERIAKLAASTRTVVAARWFDDAGEREARRIAGESVPHPGAGHS